VDNLDFDIDIVSKVIIKQITPRFARIAEAKTAKGGVLGVPKEDNSDLKPSKKTVIESAKIISRVR